MTFDPRKPFTTRSGLPARLLAADLKHPTRPIAAAVTHREGESSYSYTLSGNFYSDGDPSDIDLVNVPEERELWLNMYEDGTVSASHPSRDTADRGAVNCRIACVHVRYKAGEGL